MARYNLASRLAALCLAVSLGALVAGCDDDLAGGPGRSLRPISNETVALMQQKDTTPSSPVLIRTYKKEAEFEVWKMKSDGRYALLKTYPMCRWSGQLGPKTREGDRQVPEGFYAITPGQMNPNSNYYLSYNVGYPNAYDRAFNRTGGTIMVHGACSSAGCFSMTDQQIAEIYAIAREAFNGGQREIQMQSYPFHMTAENLAKHRLDPNIDFWRQLKNGSDHFEVTKSEPTVAVCGKRYVFGAHADGNVDPIAPCPALHKDEAVESEVAAKQAEDDAAVAALVAKGVKPVELVYDDGGQNVAFAGRADVSRPDAIASGPREIELDPSTGRPISETWKATAAAAAATPAIAVASAAQAAPTGKSANLVALAPAPVAASAPADTMIAPLNFAANAADSGKSLVRNWLKLGGDDASAVKAVEPAQPVPSDVPVPPQRTSADAVSSGPQGLAKPLKLAALKPATAKGKASPDALDAAAVSAPAAQ
jgi:murein L,D-transpeptidase YafK